MASPRAFPPLLALLLAFGSCASNAQDFRAFLTRLNATPAPGRAAVADSFLAAHAAFPLVEHDTECTFIWRGDATSVTVPGDANDWDGAAFAMRRVAGTDLWYRTARFESDARLDYKIVINGREWILDPRNPHQVSGGYGPNSEVRMPAYAPSLDIAPHPGVARGVLLDTAFASARLGGTRGIALYLPPGYSPTASPYPVVLFHDGRQYVTLGDATTVLDNLIARKAIRPVVAVFVPPVDRNAEYAGSTMDAYCGFIIDELLPRLEARFNITRTAAERVTIGASNGGNIALYLGVMHPDVFGRVAAQSANVIPAISTALASGPVREVKFWLDVGTYDIDILIPLNRALRQLLADKGYAFCYHEYHEGHSWGNWRAHVGDALKYLLELKIEN